MHRERPAHTHRIPDFEIFHSEATPCDPYKKRLKRKCSSDDPRSAFLPEISGSPPPAAAMTKKDRTPPSQAGPPERKVSSSTPRPRIPGAPQTSTSPKPRRRRQSQPSPAAPEDTQKKPRSNLPYAQAKAYKPPGERSEPATYLPAWASCVS